MKPTLHLTLAGSTHPLPADLSNLERTTRRDPDIPGGHLGVDILDYIWFREPGSPYLQPVRTFDFPHHIWEQPLFSRTLNRLCKEGFLTLSSGGYVPGPRAHPLIQVRYETPHPGGLPR